MNTDLPLEKMSTEEKLQAMEKIWEDLCEKAESVASPSWHQEILDDREQRLKQGDDEFIDWEMAKNNIKNKI